MKAEIDKLPRLKLSDLKGLFLNWRKIRDIADRLPKDELRPYISGTFTLGGVKYYVEAKPDFQTGEIGSLLFLWKRGEEEYYKSVVEILWEPSNLKDGCKVAYFVCPYNGLKCRKLYTDGYKFASRRAIKHVYSYQKQSRREREMDKLFKRLDYDTAVRKYGKEVYRGKLTRYGRKLNKFLQEIPDQRAIAAVFATKKMGRPKGSGTKAKASGNARPRPDLFLK